MKLLTWIDSLINRLVKNYTLWIFIGLGVLIFIAYEAYSSVFIRLPEPPVYGLFTVLPPVRTATTPTTTPGPTPPAAASTPGLANDTWTNEQRERYYQTSQGSLVMPYSWFRALEWRSGTERFASPNVQSRYGLLPDTDPIYNKEQMPVGIVKDIVPSEYINNLGQGHKEWASLSCAACHTGQIQYKGTAMRIDGGQGFWNFDKWSGDMVFSLMLTTVSAKKFERFCSRVVHDDHGLCTKDETRSLRRQIKAYLESDLVLSAINALIKHTYPTTEGYTRTSALGRGINGEFGPLDPCKGALDRHCYRNVDINTGPVSYPPLWYTHEYDWVQSTTSISQPLGRNITESWGVNVRVELNDPDKRFASTAKVDDQFWMETLLSILQAPKWPEDIFGQKIDPARVERGRYLFEQAVWDKAPPADKAELPSGPNVLGPNPTRPTTGYCARCHAPAFQEGKPFLQLPLYRQEVMGTDADDAAQFADRKIYPGVLTELIPKEQMDSEGRTGVGSMLTVAINGILNRWFKEHRVQGKCQEIMQGFRPNIFRAPRGYPARPLDGYWATGPYLHNGSVRTMYELLVPVEERAKTFWIGTREYDPVALGYRDEAIEGAFLYDTSQQGNSNKGHEFRDAPAGTVGVIGPSLSHDDRLAIIEYLKVLNSVQPLLDANPQTKNRLAQRQSLLAALSPFYENNQGWIVEQTKPGADNAYSGREDFCGKLEAAYYGPGGELGPTPTPVPVPYAPPSAPKK